MNLKSTTLFPTHARLIRESAGCGFHFPVYRVTTLAESSQDPVYRGLTEDSVRIAQTQASIVREEFRL